MGCIEPPLQRDRDTDTEREIWREKDRARERPRRGETEARREKQPDRGDRGRDREAGDRDYGVAFSRDFKLFDRKFAKVVTSYSVVMPHYQRSCL